MVRKTYILADQVAPGALLDDPAFDFAKGIAYWNLGNTDDAVAT